MKNIIREQCRFCGGEVTPIINTCKLCGKTHLVSSPSHDLIPTNGVVLGNNCEACSAFKARKVKVSNSIEKDKTAYLCFDCYIKQADYSFNFSDRSRWHHREISRAKTLRKYYLEKIYYGEWEQNKTENELILKRELDKIPQYEVSSAFKESSKHWTTEQHRKFFFEMIPQLGKKI